MSRNADRGSKQSILLNRKNVILTEKYPHASLGQYVLSNNPQTLITLKLYWICVPHKYIWSKLPVNFVKSKSKDNFRTKHENDMHAAKDQSAICQNVPFLSPKF